MWAAYNLKLFMLSEVPYVVEPTVVPAYSKRYPSFRIQRPRSGGNHADRNNAATRPSATSVLYQRYQKSSRHTSCTSTRKTAHHPLWYTPARVPASPHHFPKAIPFPCTPNPTKVPHHLPQGTPSPIYLLTFTSSSPPRHLSLSPTPSRGHNQILLNNN